MRLTRPALWILTATIVAALCGLIAVQVYLLSNAFELKAQAFKQNVGGALGMTSVRLATNETVANMFEKEIPGKRVPRTTITTEVRTANGNSGEVSDTAYVVRKLEAPPLVRVRGDSFFYSITTPQRVLLRLSDALGNDSTVVDSLKPAGEHMFLLRSEQHSGDGLFYRFTTDSMAVAVDVSDHGPARLVRKPGSEGERNVLVSRAIDNFWMQEGEPIERRIRPALLDTVLRRSMREAGVPLDFAYGVMTGSDSVALAVPPDAGDLLRTSAFRSPLFLVPGPASHTRLVVFFPGQQLYLLKQLWPVLAASVVFIALIVFGFAYTIRTIMRQQRLGGLMVDFINNMTHEFKTPLSTVALASEAIDRPDMVTQKTKVLQYNRLIADETRRMKKHVDRILQMAQLEEGEIELSMSPVDLHELIRTAAANFALQVETRGGRIALNLDAAPHTIVGDPVHLLNVLQNLLDNAIKYSPESAEITVTTGNIDHKVTVQVADRGSGIPREHHERVFEKYYRVPMGNRHDVKGFGIGLRYVKLLVEAHGGTIGLQSEPGKGTEIVLAFKESEA